MNDDDLLPITDEELTLDLNFAEEYLKVWTAAFSAALDEQLSRG